MRVIRWVGHPAPLYDHNIVSRIKKGTLDPQLVLAFQRFEHNRRISVNVGRSTFTIGPQHGFSREYTWGPKYFDRRMADADWARLCRNPSDRHMFLDVTNGVPPVRRLLTPAEWTELMSALDRFPPPNALVGPEIFGARR